MTWLADDSSTNTPNIGASGELVLAADADPAATGSYLVVTGTVTAAGSAALQLWRMSAAGAFTYVGAQTLGNGRNLSLANDGVGKFGVSYTSGTATSGTPRVEVWDVTQAGVFTRTLGWSETSGGATATAIAPLGPAATKSGITAGATLSSTQNSFTSATCGANFTPSKQASQGSAAAFLTAAQRSAGATLAVWDSPKHYLEV